MQSGFSEVVAVFVGALGRRWFVVVDETGLVGGLGEVFVDPEQLHATKIATDNSSARPLVTGR